MTSFRDCFLFCQYKELRAVIVSFLSGERTQIFMTSFYNINCISNCFSLSAESLASPWWCWAVLGFMKSGLSPRKFRRGSEGGGHISCLVALLCSEAWALAGCQRRRTCPRGPAARTGLLLPRDQEVREASRAAPWAPSTALPRFLHLEHLSSFLPNCFCISSRHRAHSLVFSLKAEN